MRCCVFYDGRVKREKMVNGLREIENHRKLLAVVDCCCFGMFKFSERERNLVCARFDDVLA